jgi:cytochrome c oxidase subunit 4
MPPRHLVAAWAALLLLLGLTVLLAYQPLGEFNTPVALLIATAKASIVVVIFMELRERDGVMIAFAAAGFFWLGILLWLAAADFLVRPQFPPSSSAASSAALHRYLTIEPVPSRRRVQLVIFGRS